MATADLVVDRVEFIVEAGKIAEFARATLTADDVHSGDLKARRAGLAARAATPTHVVVAGHHRDQQAMVDLLGLDLGRVVVGSVRWTYARPLVADDHLSGTRRVVTDERRPARDGSTMRLVTLETRYVDAAGVTAVTTTEVIIERGVSV